MKLTKKQWYWVASIFLLYMAINIVISGFYITIKYIPTYIKTINWTEFMFSVLFSITIGVLVSLNAVVSYEKCKRHQQAKTQTALTCIGTVGGLATGVCSACVTGFIPLMLSIFGISFSFASLPFKGLEVQALVIIILAISLWVQR